MLCRAENKPFLSEVEHNFFVLVQEMLPRVCRYTLVSTLALSTTNHANYSLPLRRTEQENKSLYITDSSWKYWKELLGDRYRVSPSYYVSAMEPPLNFTAPSNSEECVVIFELIRLLVVFQNCSRRHVG